MDIRTIDNKLCERCSKNQQDCIVYDRLHMVLMCVCEKCSHIISDETSPEYIVHCPNCGCCFGVN